MNYPSFFNEIPQIRLFDPLGGFLGAFDNGIVEISYYDCVKLAGHSCPTVASAYLLAYIGLDKLYSDSIPERSRIKIELSNPKDEGVTGVIGNVISYIAGANDESGFKGIGKSFSRNNLIEYGVDGINGAIRLTRLDTGDSISLASSTESVPGSPEMMPLMQRYLQGEATDEEIEKFHSLWQGRVKAMLTNHDLWNKIITIG